MISLATSKLKSTLINKSESNLTAAAAIKKNAFKLKLKPHKINLCIIYEQNITCELAIIFMLSSLNQNLIDDFSTN
jgi:hypothetical protein